MDSQELRNLQEAYTDVYTPQELDEGYMPATQKRADKMRKQVSKLRRTASEKGDFGHPESEKKHNQADTVLRFSRLTSDLAKKRDKDAKKSEFNEDLYDIILSHLLDEGYADTQEAAEAIMVNMSEEWRQSIIEVLDTQQKLNDYGLKNIVSATKAIVNKDEKTYNKRLRGAEGHKRKMEKMKGKYE
jgi:hypothetical protein